MTPGSFLLIVCGQLSRLEKYRSRRQQQAAEGAESKDDTGSDRDSVEFGTRSKVSLLDQHSELKKKAEGGERSKTLG